MLPYFVAVSKPNRAPLCSCLSQVSQLVWLLISHLASKTRLTINRALEGCLPTMACAIEVPLLQPPFYEAHNCFLGFFDRIGREIQRGLVLEEAVLVPVCTALSN